ncbi:FAD-dependent monooxygenase [Mucilaginibacter ginsenosidivorans]|uniref:Flavin-dependent monooxygenase n=2 Tax=Mucilaginibacter ginsenosidivorans TaxID=398053 RepID=A0A5B8V3K3_9SPHI|nr:FAD-dependent monooxygenase [Mucilaginibacter ginsenosidivorans]
MNSIQDKSIAIVGGGPGGLTLARLLQMNDADVKVYERDENRSVRVQGATLDLHYDSGLKALSKAGLMDHFKANYRPGADKTRITGEDATILFEDDFAATDDDELARPEIDRGPLREILLDSLQSGTVIWDSNFVSMNEQNGAFRLDFKNGSEAFADIVIAADGANSKIRPYITPVKPFYAGITALEGAVYNSESVSPNIHQLLSGGKIFALADGKSLIVSSKGDGSLVFYAGFYADESWAKDCGVDFSNNKQVLAWFKKEFAGWADIWDELFENSFIFTPRLQYCMPFDQNWIALPNLTMLGDAAHLMPPYAGEGVNMAMLDALELAECLLSKDIPSVHCAIAAYESKMRIRAVETARMTMEQTAALHSPDGLDHMLGMFQQNG